MSKNNKNNKNNFSPIAIIGIGCLFPEANDKAAYWGNIMAGVDAISEIPQSHWNIEDYFNSDPKAPDQTYAQRGGFLRPVDFDPMEFGIPPNSLEATDTSQLLGLVAAREALADAGYSDDTETKTDKARVSVILGVTGALELVVSLGARLGHPHWKRGLREAGVDEETARDVVERIGESYASWQEASFPGLLGNVVAGRIANQFDLGGTNCVVDAACASALSALHLACLELHSGRKDMVLTGGVDTFNDIFMYMCFSKTPALSPSGDARPFDQNADGTILGEGLGMLVLKTEADAIRDGDRIYATIRGLGSSSDGKGNAVYAPNASGQAKALRAAYEMADISPSTIELVEAHGTGTQVGDTVEINALTSVYREAQQDGTWCALGSVKSQIGHTKAAAGAAGIIKAALALHHKVLPPTIKVDQPLASLAGGNSPFYVNTEKRPWLKPEGHPRRAAVSAFGFGGSNFHCLLEEAEPEKIAADFDGTVQIIAFSAAHREDIHRQVSEWAPFSTWEQLRIEAREFRQVFDSFDQYRLIFVAEKDRSELAKMRDSAMDLLEKQAGEGVWNTPNGVFFGSGNPEGNLGILFPGQGSQYVGMFRDLACRFPQMRTVLADVDRVFLEEQGNLSILPPSKFIYPHPVFDDASNQENEKRLSETQIAQPAIGAVSLGAWKVLDEFGVRPAAIAGHSYGEVTALCVAGKIDASAFYSLSKLRGALMASGDGDRGAMLAVRTPIEDIPGLIEEAGLNLVLANKNTPNQAVLSGSSEAIEQAQTILKGRQIQATRLPVSAAFHSPLVAEVQKPFRAALQAIHFSAGNRPVYSNTTGKEYPAEPDQARTILADQLAHPVEFVEEIENMYSAGIRTFLEVGPGAKLSGLVDAILDGRPFAAFSMDASSGKRAGAFDLAQSLAHLAALGHRLNLLEWDATAPIQKPVNMDKKPKMTLPLTGANYRTPFEKKPPRPALSPQAKTETIHPSPVSKPVIPMQETSTEPKADLPLAPQAPTNAPAGPIQEAIRLTQQSLISLQQMQEQTASLHRKFLEGQESAQQTIRTLVEQQRLLFQGGEAVPMPPSPATPLSPSVTMTHQATSAPPVQPVVPKPASEPVAQIPPTPLAVASDVSSAKVGDVLLTVVAEKTGYPVEMLDLDMGLDTDLGIDSIKRVEILSALAEALPEAPAVQPEDLGSLQTLGQIVEFLSSAMLITATSVTASQETSVIDDSRVAEVLLQVVSEKTGYPVEMLDLTMGLDTDLGIDSIKRVEILSALSEALPEAPAVQPEDLGSLQTLGQIVEFLSSAMLTVPTSVPVSQGLSPIDNNKVATVLLQVVSEKTGYPVEMLDLTMGLDTDLGIDSIKRVEILSALSETLPEAPAVHPEDLGSLQTLGQIVDFLAVATQASEAVTAQTEVKPQAEDQTTAISTVAPLIERSILKAIPLKENSLRGSLPLEKNATIWVSNDGTELSLQLVNAFTQRGFSAQLIELDDRSFASTHTEAAGLLLVAPDNCSDQALFNSLQLFQTAVGKLTQTAAGARAFFATLSKLGGTFALSGAITNTTSGGLAGLLKTAAHEYPSLPCKAIDLSEGVINTADSANRIVAELLLEGPLEVGFSDHATLELTLQKEDIPAVGKFPLMPEAVVIITGGGRGVTAETAIALASTAVLRIALLGRSKAPKKEPKWLQDIVSEADIKQAILLRSKTKLLPKEVGGKYQVIAANRELLGNLARIEAAGSQVAYYTTDVRDPQSVKKTLAKIRQELGPIAGLIHGAGVLEDRLIIEKTADQFDRVYGTKVEGLRNLLGQLTDEDNLKLLVLFSSSTGRFGRKGQVDYAMANEVLNKIAQYEAATRNDCRVASFNWGPWQGGMVTPALAEIFAREGVGLIPLAAGGEHLVKELSTLSPAAIETVVLGAVNKPASSQINGILKSIPQEAANTDAVQTAYELVLNIEAYPFLESHVINGKAVLPLAMMVEWLAHGALHANPGYTFIGYDQFRVIKGVLIGKEDHLALSVRTGKPVYENSQTRVPVELWQTETNGADILHSKTMIVLADSQHPGTAIIDASLKDSPGLDIQTAYSSHRLFHGTLFQGIESVELISVQGVVATLKQSPAPKQWLKSPLRSTWIADPLSLDGCFQMMILWSFERYGKGCLPCYSGSYRQFRNQFPAHGIRIVLQITKDSDKNPTANLEIRDRETGELVAWMKDCECIIDVTLEASFRNNVIESRWDLPPYTPELSTAPVLSESDY